MYRPASYLLQLFVLCSLTCCCACSSGTPLYPVEGKVLYKGKELSNVMLTFHPERNDSANVHPPTGLTTDDGTFKLTTGKDVGAPPGKYTVTFVWLKEVRAKEKKGIGLGGPSSETIDAFGGIFANAKKSKHNVTIKSENTKLEPFRLD